VKITQDKIENRQAYLTVEMEQAEVDDGLNRAYNRLVRKASVPGFRKGKTPRPILEQYLGKSALLEEAVEIMAPDAFEKAAKELDLKAIARPEIQLDKAEPVIYKMVVPLEPVIKLSDYKQVKLTPDSIELKEEDVNNTIEQLQHQHAVWEPVDRQVNVRDQVILDIESSVGAQPYINQKDAEFEVTKDSEFPIKGFAEELIGLKKEETKEFKLSFPQDYGRAELAGKEASFKVTIKEIKQEKLPEVNDDFAKLVNPEFKTVEEMRAKVTESLKKNLDDKNKKDFQQKVIDTIVEQAQIEYPAIMEEEEIDELITNQMRRWQMDEKGMEEYLKNINRTPEQLREELRPTAQKTVKQALVLTELAKAESIQVNQDDVKAEVETMTQSLPAEGKDRLVQLLTAPQSQMNIASSIATRRTIDRLVGIVTGTAEAAQTTEKTENAEAKEAEAPQKEA
jgi:trigger factor